MSYYIKNIFYLLNLFVLYCCLYLPFAIAEHEQVSSETKSVGVTEVMPHTIASDSRRAMPFSMPEDGEITHVSMYHLAGNGRMILAVYNDKKGLPGKLLAKTDTIAVSGVAGWQRAALQTKASVFAGTRIWLAWVYDNNPGIVYGEGLPGRATVNEVWRQGADNMPDDFGHSTTSKWRYSIYAEYIPVDINNPPEFKANPVVKPEATQGLAYTATLAADVIDADDDNLTFSKVAGPSWLLIESDGVLSGIPAVEDLGLNTFSIEVSDGQAVATAMLTIVVNEANNNTAPVFVVDPIVKDAATQDLPYSATLQGDASDADADTLVFSKVAGAAWLSVADDGALTGTPLVADVGVNTFTVVVSDGQAMATAVLNILVNPAVNVPDPVPDNIEAVGETNILPDMTVASDRRAMPFMTSKAGQLISVTMYHMAGNGNMQLAVYADDAGFPGALLGKTPVTAVSDVAGWQTIELESAVEVVAQMPIWLAWIYEINPGIAFAEGSPGRADANVVWDAQGDNMPSSFGGSTVVDLRYSIYASYRSGVNDNNNNMPPVFDMDPIVQDAATVGEAYSGVSLAAHANDADADPLTFSKVAGPQWLSVAVEGALSGTPLEVDLGTNIFTVEVSDGQANAMATMSIEVNAMNELNTADLGETSILGGITNAPDRRAMPFTMPEAGTVSSITMYHKAGTGSFVLGVYADNGGVPGALLAKTAVTAVSDQDGWQTVELENVVEVAAETPIWVAWVYEINPGIAFAESAPGRADANVTWNAQADDNMPSEFGSSTVSDVRYSIYITYIK